MSGLLHLVEAATALTQLGPSILPPSTAYQAVSPSASSVLPAFAATSYSRRASPAHTISDDDTSANNACIKMAALRENHLHALRVAAANAGLAVQPAQSMKVVAAPTVYPMNQQVMATPAYTADQAPYSQQVTTTTIMSQGEATKEMFPMRLHALLADSQVRAVISWLPHGKSFVVLRPDVFATSILPRYFAPEGSNSLNVKTTLKVTQGVHKYPSFTRKLNRWGFRQISRGPDAGAFCHELFQRDYPHLCRGMVCQKSRKLKKSPMSGGIQDDMVSVSSASTMETKSIASCEKRPFSSMVTVSTAGGTSNKSLPLKKRKSGQHMTNDFMMNDIPQMISHRPQHMAASTSSMTESDLTSDSGSVGPSNVALKAPAKTAVNTNDNASQSTEATAREALARHFHEQHRAFALASLMANSHLAMEAVGMNQASASGVAATSTVQRLGSGECIQKYTPVLGAITTHSAAVIAHTVSVPEEK